MPTDGGVGTWTSLGALLSLPQEEKDIFLCHLSAS
jgi:hypothetical protein